MPDTALRFHVLDPDTAPLLRDATVFDNPVDPEQLTRFVEDPGHLLIFAQLGDRVVGFASAVVLLHPDKPPACFVNEVDVDPAYQRQGLGTALCARVFDLARAKGCQGIWLATEDDNLPARGLYHHLSGRETTGIVVYDWDGAMDDPA